MSSLNDKEIKRLAKLGKDIIKNLSCHANDQGIPCRSDRFAVIDAMTEYLLINNVTSTLEY